MKKGVLWWFIFVLLFLWQLPQNIIGLFMMLWFKDCDSLELIDHTDWTYAFKSKEMLGGISLGTFCFLSENDALNPAIVAHEMIGHPKQSRMLGWLYLFVVGIPSILHAEFRDRQKSCYYDYWCERWANDLAGIEADENCRLRFKENSPTV